MSDPNEDIETELVELNPNKVYIVLAPLKALPHLTMAAFPKNVVAGFPKELVEFEELAKLVDRLGYRLVEKADPRYNQEVTP